MLVDIGHITLTWLFFSLILLQDKVNVQRSGRSIKIILLWVSFYFNVVIQVDTIIAEPFLCDVF